MPVKRRAAKRRDHLVTPAAIIAFGAGDRKTLHRELGLKPWHESPIDAEGDCPWPAGSAGATGWQLSADLRTEIMEARDAR